MLTSVVKILLVLVRVATGLNAVKDSTKQIFGL